MAKINLETQISALEITIVNKRGFIETLHELVKARKRDPVELELAERTMPGLEAALETLKWVKANESMIREAFSRQGGA